MSRIGRKPVAVPAGVTVAMEGQTIKVKGKKGELTLKLLDDLVAKVEKDKVALSPKSVSKRSKMMWGLQRSLLANMMTGVSNGFQRSLEITGVGFRAAVAGKELQLQLGFSHEVKFPIPTGIEIKAEKPTLLHITGVDRQLVGQVAAEIRALRQPEPYKGKGIKYVGEAIRRKEGKKK